MDLTTAAMPARTAAEVRLRASIGISVLFIASGASGLMLEVVWSRMLGWILGATTWSVMTILVAFMGGLGLGGILLGRLASRSARPLRLFGRMEIAIGLYSLAVPVLFESMGGFFVSATRLLGDAPEIGLALRIITAVVALAPPTLLMGGTLPVLTRFAASGRAEPGRTAGWLYAANTAGAVVGCFATGCLLIYWLGVGATNWAAAIIDLGVGFSALAWDRWSIPLAEDYRPSSKSVAGPALGNVTLLLACVSGFCGMAYELLWSRGLLATFTDDTTYAFTLMLTAFLAGHALGAGLAGRFGSDPRRGRGWQRLGTAQILAGTTALMSLPLLVLIRDPINKVSFNEGMSFWGGRIPFHLAISLAVFAPSAAFLGASFAMTARLYVGVGRPIGASTGWLYGVNTLGAIAGAIISTAWLIPVFGTQGAVILLGLLQFIAGSLTILLLGGGFTRWWSRAATVAGWAVVAALAFAVNQQLSLTSIFEKQEPGRLLTVLEGSGSAITVHQRTPTDRVISINGVNVAGTNAVLRATQKLQAHLPVCLHPSPRSVLQIGFGSGGTCYSVSLHPEVESIEVVELNPDVLKVASAWFGDINHGVLENPRVRKRIADAKSYVASTDRTYDLILSDSTHPRFRGNAALYARDYFANCARRLNPGGMLSTWLPLYGQSVEDIQGILKSMQSVFPHVQVWYPNSEPHENTIVIASLNPIAVDPERLSIRLADGPVAGDLAEVGMTSTVQVLDFFMLGDRAVAEFSRSARLNTDDHPRLEFLAPRSLRRLQSWTEDFAALRLSREPIEPYLVNANAAWLTRMSKWYAGTTWKLAGQSLELETRPGEALKAYTEGVRLNPEDVLAAIRLERFRKALGPSSSVGLVPRTGG